MPADHVRDVASVMLTCGMYDAAGQWFYDVGIPAKSGVSGGIVAAIPERLGIAVYSPGLDVHGNSARGVAICRDLSTHFGLHMFAAPHGAAGRAFPSSTTSVRPTPARQGTDPRRLP
jgi:glutaminase